MSIGKPSLASSFESGELAAICQQENIMTIAQKLSWEIIAMNEREPGQMERTAIEVAYGVALQVGNQPDLFSAIMASIIIQVSDETLQHCLRVSTARGLKK